jgi:hypothetical protein
MATGDYCTVDEYRASRMIPDSLDDAEIGRVISVASREVDNHCGRVFYQDAAPSARHFVPPSGDTLIVDDISTTTGLVVVDFGRTLVLDSDFGLFPTDGVTNSGEAGPYYKLTKFYNVGWFQAGKGATVTVTAQWGWPAVPVVVKDACMAVVADRLMGRNNSFGVIGLDTGAAVRVRGNVTVEHALRTYRGVTAPQFGFA